MSLIRWREPVDVMPSFQSLVDTFFGREFPGFSKEVTGTVPAVNVKESDSNFMLEVAVPGMNKENFDIRVDNDVMTISGKKEEKKEEKEDKWSRREFSYSSFERSFQLPEIVDADKIEAHYQDGILHVMVPKKEMTKMKASKTISIS